MTGRRTSGDSSPSITAPLVSTWMTFGEGNDVDVAIVVKAAGIGQGHRYGLADNCLLLGCFSYPPSSVHGRVFVSVPLPSSAKKNKEKTKITGGVGCVSEISLGCGDGPSSSGDLVDTGTRLPRL